jgi:hypothetical protein
MSCNQSPKAAPRPFALARGLFGLIRAGERDASGVPDYSAVVEVLPAS